ncbi:phage/plasmid replication domain-containing protein [Pontibacter pamirensis]|uniref:phage/plasmid replication domain-containing protein n=1 Tax=Pontibacter pamirensis TaxID=2562824 RepID=UPI0013895792|nr:phage/plasmid replication protein [Pontibacter pamirensis]
MSEHGISIIGSLAKFYLGSNLHTLNRSDSRRAFEQLADTMHLPIQRAVVSRVDIGMNLITQHTPELYFPYLGQSSYYKRLTQPQSISYQNNLRSKKFYNKIAESKSKSVLIPNVYQGKNLLRYEVCYMQRLPKQFNTAAITPNTLTEECFYMGLIDRVVKEYQAIQKNSLVKMDTTKIKSPKDYLKQVLALAIQEKGLDAFLHHVDLLKEQNTFDKPEYYSRLRSEIKKLSGSNNTTTDTPEMIQELNRKIARVSENYR